VGIEAGGCSGFQYTFNLCAPDAAEEGDVVVHQDGMTFIVDGVSMEFVKGSMIDYEEDLMRASFVIVDNPQAESSCGCGSSFLAK